MIKVTLSLPEFLSFATHNGLFDSVCLTDYPSIVEDIEKTPGYTHCCFIEKDNGRYTLWLRDSWRVELRRREEIKNACLVRGTIVDLAETNPFLNSLLK